LVLKLYKIQWWQSMERCGNRDKGRREEKRREEKRRGNEYGN
jgi:predicted RNA-binding Zn ribbon-like protein